MSLGGLQLKPSISDCEIRNCNELQRKFFRNYGSTARHRLQSGNTTRTMLDAPTTTTEDPAPTTRMRKQQQ